MLVPLAAWCRQLWLAAGIVVLHLMLAVWVSTQLRSRIGYSWLLLQTLTFAVYLLATLHGLETGTDTRQPWALALYAGSVLLVGVLLRTRLLAPIGPRGRSHPRLAALTAVVLVGGIAWAVTGPAHAGWSATAGPVLWRQGLSSTCHPRITVRSWAPRTLEME